MPQHRPINDDSEDDHLRGWEVFDDESDGLLAGVEWAAWAVLACFLVWILVR